MPTDTTGRTVRRQLPPKSVPDVRDLAAQSRRVVAEARLLKALAKQVLAQKPCWDAGDVSHHETPPQGADQRRS